MSAEDALELLNMFTTAVQMAKLKNKKEIHLEIDESYLISLLKKAYPKINDNNKLAQLAKNILHS